MDSNTMYQNNPNQTPADNGNKLCIISLCLYIGRYFASAIVYGIYVAITRTLTEINPGSEGYLSLFYGLCGVVDIAMAIAAYILVVLCRVKYKENRFGKVLMWVYIALFIANVILVVVGILAFAILCYECARDCPGLFMF